MSFIQNQRQTELISSLTKTEAICYGFVPRRLKPNEENPSGYERIKVDVCEGRGEKSDESNKVEGGATSYG